MQKYTTAIEITNQYFKLVALNHTLKGPEITALFFKTISSESNEGLVPELIPLIKSLKFSPSPLIVSLPRNLVTMRNLHLPSTDPKEIESMIDLHMGRQVPYPREEIIGSHQGLGLDESGYSKVMLAIAHRQSLQLIFNTLDKINLFPEKIELSSQGVLSHFLYSQKNRLEAGHIYALLDIDINFTDFMVVDKDSLIFSRSIAYGAQQVSDQEIVQKKFLPELKQSLVIFQSEEMNKKPARLFISGAIDNIGGLDTFLAKELNIEVEMLKPALATPTQVPKNVSISALLGLALDTHRKRINFILPEIQIRKALKERGRDLVVLGSLLMFILMLCCGIFLERLSNRTGYLRLLKTKFQAVKDEVEQLESKAARIKVCRERLNLRALNLNYLYQVNKAVSNEIAIKMITFEADERITLRGQAQAMSDVFKFVTSLENSKYFKDVQVKYTSKKRINDKDLTEFEIICPFVLSRK